jgi:drug/metabolite transporter (DMT)-like permease
MAKFIAVLIAALIWALLIILAGWSFGYSVPFFGAWVIGFAIVVLINLPRGGLRAAMNRP